MSEPSRTIPADWRPGDFSPADFRTLAQVVYAYDEVPTTVPDGPIVTDPAPVLNIFTTSEFTEDIATSARSLAKGESPASITGASTAQATAEPTISHSSTAASAAPPATDGTLPAIKQAKVFPVFKDPMGEPLRLLHPDLFVPGLGDFPAGGVAVLDANQAFIEAYMVGLNHALGSELSWRGFPWTCAARSSSSFGT